MASEKKAVEIASRPARGCMGSAGDSGSTLDSCVTVPRTAGLRGGRRYTSPPPCRREHCSERSWARRLSLMANINSQEKRIHRSERERVENRRRTSTVKTYFRRLERAVEGGDGEAIDAEHRALVSKIDKAAEHGALHRNNAARKKSRAARIRPGGQA